MKFFEVVTLAAVAGSQLTLNSSIPCDQFETLNLIENVKPICSIKNGKRFRCSLHCANTNQTAWPLKKIGCKVTNEPGSKRYKPDLGKC